MTEPEIIQACMQQAEAFFDTANDPGQIPVSMETLSALRRLWQGAFSYQLDTGGSPVCWAVAIPTSQELMQQFLRGAITEKQLLAQTVPASVYDALYLCSVYTVPQARRQGRAVELLQTMVQRAPLASQAALFSWPTTHEGECALAKFERVLGRKVLRRIGSIA